ncbi:hypothetical protein BS78_09G116600 [Paspalum vaginatum]|nr:hypothetical protein BS78_09G116600 [Paspalum vaginatum]
MAEIVGSAVASEAVSRVISSSFLSGDRTESVEDRAERLEMAVLKIRSAVAVSEDLHVRHLPLLQWKAKLKRVAEEGDDLLHALHKKQTLERSRATTSGTSISQHLIRAAKSFAPFLRRSEDEPSDGTLRRFERLADGADGFLRLAGSGHGHPEKPVRSPSPMTRSLLAGDSVEFSVQRNSGGGDLVMVWPWTDRPDGEGESGSQAGLVVSREDESAWAEGFWMCVVFRLSEASDVPAIAASCLELLPPQFGAARVAIRRLLVLAETLGQSGGGGGSDLPRTISKWLRRLVQNNHSRWLQHRGAGTGVSSLLPHHPVLRIYTLCYASPSAGGSSSPVTDGGGRLPLELLCHASPCLSPEKYSSRFDLAEHDAIGKMLPEVTDGFYGDATQALSADYKRQIWCPQSSMYFSAAPAVSRPLTVS